VNLFQNADFATAVMRLLGDLVLVIGAIWAARRKDGTAR
jgi:hypothetical protein